MPEAQSSATSPNPQRDPPSGSPTGPLGWLSLTPAVSIAVFLLVAMFTLDSSGESNIGLALIAGVLIGPPASYLLNRYWPTIATGDHPAPSPPSPEAKP